jgi:hypothetical protein
VASIHEEILIHAPLEKVWKLRYQAKERWR